MHVDSSPGAEWRLIVDEPSDGWSNMAVDCAIHEARTAGDSPPTLRLYGWRRPTVTLGRFQPLRDVDTAACERYGCDVVRRPTGGRGVLHDDEVTYSVVAGVSDGVPRGVAASYRYLCAALAEAYRLLGVPADLTRRRRGSALTGACYLHATAADLSLGAAKLSGSAQVWRGDAVLQHGSFVITRDVAREAAVFGLDEVEAAELDATTATLGDVLGRSPSHKDIIEAVIAGAQRTLGVRLVHGALTEGESRRASVLASEGRALLLVESPSRVVT